MRLSHAWKLVTLMLFATVAFTAVAQKSAPPNLSQLLKMGGIDSSYVVTYRDDHGKAITKNDFVSRISHGHSFEILHDTTAHTATLTLQAAKDVVGAMAQYKIRPGEPFPSFHLQAVGGGSVDNAALRGHPVVLNFFFADCVGCIAETPALNAYAKAHPDVRVLAVTFDDAKTAAAYVKQRHFAWPVAYGGKALDDALGIKAYPTMALLDVDGRLLDIRLSGSLQTGGGNALAKDLDHWVQRTLAKSHDHATSAAGASAASPHAP